ncbi:MAG: hypothetical protein U5N53_29040, partial [Mycobacterium sp.]|nr:hypothetical protein [Mycobacterium sp.]
MTAGPDDDELRTVEVFQQRLAGLGRLDEETDIDPRMALCPGADGRSQRTPFQGFQCVPVDQERDGDVAGRATRRRGPHGPQRHVQCAGKVEGQLEGGIAVVAVDPDHDRLRCRRKNLTTPSI